MNEDLMTTDRTSLFPELLKNTKVFCLIFSLFSFTFAADAGNVSTIIKKIDARFSGIASTKKIGTMGIDSMNTFFSTVINKIPAIENLMRINSNGVVINEISENSTDFKMRSVSEQKWFIHVKTTLTPYYGTNRDTSGVVVFFWSWPMVTGDSIFNGAISAKIKPKDILRMSSVNDSAPIALFLNDMSMFKRFTYDIKNAVYDTIRMSSQSLIIIETQSVEPDIIAETENSSDTLSKNNRTTIHDTVSSAEVSGTATHDNDLFSQEVTSPVVYESDFLEPLPKKKHSPVAALFLIILSAMFLSAAFYIFMRSRNRQIPKIATLPELTQEELSQSKFDITQIVEEETLAIVDPHSHQDISDEQILTDNTNANTDNELLFTSDANIEANDADDETKSHPPHIFNRTELAPGTSLINKNIKPELVNSSANEISPELKLRNSLYREVHNEVMQWVISESVRLENRIEELQHRLSIIENMNTHEVKQISKDIQDISRDVNVFKSDITTDNQ
jgi:hypothetical protein